MAQKRSSKAGPNKPRASESSAPPAPFKQPPDVLKPFIEILDPQNVYVTHIDSKPVDHKRKIFAIPVFMNVCVVALFAWRMYCAVPWYWKLVLLGLGHHNELYFDIGNSSWSTLAWEVAKRGGIMFFDFLCFIFVWPWPVEFVLAQEHGNPTQWKWTVGFRDKEIYVRRSREWEKYLKDVFADDDSRKILLAYVHEATSPLIQGQKTGYLLMNGKWDLDWEAMILAHKMVDKKDAAIEAFKNVVLLHHKHYGWLCYDIRASTVANEDEKRRQVFAFRDALTAMGKDQLFYRWIEIVQYEATQPGGFGKEKQEAAAVRIRELFAAEGIDFDELWKETVGTDGITGLGE
ncbi:hypothetical protein NLU13_8427 [Sarocladium strictum]|uniref:Uncharacterized protein n=1 Tax=Sarocladium strictum TaxID=5046 RepID=A0AA39GBN1_SARSR|nr:hypothetical protein NLU13_8427 [Sarocladium strictum]